MGIRRLLDSGFPLIDRDEGGARGVNNGPSWRTKDGRTLFISEMSNCHLFNTWYMLERKLSSSLVTYNYYLSPDCIKDDLFILAMDETLRNIWVKMSRLVAFMKPIEREMEIRGHQVPTTDSPIPVEIESARFLGDASQLTDCAVKKGILYEWV